MPKKKKSIDTNHEDVNSSYTTIVLLSTIGMGLFFGRLLPEAQYQSAIAIILYSLLLYFMLDFIQQLYNPGQAVFLYAMTYIFMPTILALGFNFPFARVGLFILIAAVLFATLFEIFYEGIVKRRMPKIVLSRLLKFDSTMDKHIINLSDKHVALTEYGGLAIGMGAVMMYLTVTYLLFH